MADRYDGAPQVLEGNAAVEIQSLRRILICLALASFSAAATNRIMDPLLPQLASEFGVTLGSVATIATAYAFAYGFFQMVFGPIGDSYGKIRLLICACAASFGMTIACAVSNSLDTLSLARLFAGIAAGAIVPMGIAWVGDAVPDAARQAVLAKFMSGQVLGLLAGQLGGGLMGEAFGWRAAFWAIAFAYLVALIGLITEVRRRPDLLQRSSTSGGFRRSVAVMLGLLRRPLVRFALATVAIEAFAMFGALTFIGASLHDRFGYGLAAIGGYLALYCIGGLLFISLSGRMLKRFGSIGMSMRGAWLVALAYVVLALTPVAGAYLPAIAALGLGFYMLHNTLQTMATRMAPDARGSAVGLFASVYFIAQACGVWLAGRVIDQHGTSPVFLGAAVILFALGIYMVRATPQALR